MTETEGNDVHGGLSLDSVAISLAALRSEAINGRAKSGIETEWTQDREFCEGIDDTNRGEHSTWISKPPGQAESSINETGSTVFLNITRPYCDAFAAMASDILQPIDDSAWGIEPTPIPEFIPLAQGKVPEGITKAISSAFPNQPQMIQQETDKIIAQAKKELEEASDKAKRAQKRIEDWHVECQYHSETRLVIKDVAEIGTGVMKGPFPVKRKHVAYIEGQLVVEEKIVPASKRVMVENMYPDPGCGENIHNGAHIWERDDITSKQLEALKGTPGYLDDQIEECLKEGPWKATKTTPDGKSSTSGLTERETKNLFEIWYFHGRMTKEQMLSCGQECDKEYVDAQVTMVNNRVIKVILNPIDTGEFPYDFIILQKRAGLPWGIGIARKIRTVQRMLISAIRALLDNAGLAARPQIILLRGEKSGIRPANGVWEVKGGKFWWADSSIDPAAIDKAFRFVTAPFIINELMVLINFSLKMAEDVTGLPMLMQGQMGQKAPDTLGGMQMLNNNASTGMRAFAHQYDDMLTEPHLRRYYRYLLQYGEDETEKGEFVINAKGSSVLVERAVQAQQMVQIGTMAQNPVFGIDPKKYSQELLKSLRIDPSRVEFDDEQWKQIVSQMGQKPQDSSAVVAELRAEVDREKIASNERIKAGEIQMEERQNELDRQLELTVKAVETELDQAGMDGDQKMNFDNLKTRLSETLMKLRSTERLAAQRAPADQMPKPPTEPAGRAQPGYSYQQ